MDQIKIGKFISVSRKEKKLTQESLAEKLGVSKNAVSKWERGINLPDVSLMEDLCKELNITLNELFAGEHLNEKDVVKQSEITIIDILKQEIKKINKYKIILTILIILILILGINTGKNILINKGILIDEDLKYTQKYVPHQGNIKGEVDIEYFENISIDFEIGANKYGIAVFKNPKVALKRLKKDYSKGISAIKKEFSLMPLSNFNYKQYKRYGWQVTSEDEEIQKQARFISNFFDIYENSFR